MFERIKQILIKEFIQIFRDPRARRIVFVMPVFQVLIFGYAVTTDVKHVQTAIFDKDNSIYSRTLRDRLVRSGYFEIKEVIHQDSQIRDLLDHGRVQVVVDINKGFGSALMNGGKAPVQFIVDGTDSNTAAIVLNYSGKIVAQYAQEILAERSSRLVG
ncbi:MAG: ABC transporter permease, partial [Desulfobacca sp.]|nr:ABC transporter permease [Desulfobacca sp.]